MKPSPANPRLQVVSSSPLNTQPLPYLTIHRFVEAYVKSNQRNREQEQHDKLRFLHEDTLALQKLRSFVGVFEHWENELLALEISNEKLRSITDQEQTIIHCIAEGLQTKEIADRLFISEHTVQTHRKNINKKLGINSAVILVKVSMMLSLKNEFI